MSGYRTIPRLGKRGWSTVRNAFDMKLNFEKLSYEA